MPDLTKTPNQGVDDDAVVGGVARHCGVVVGLAVGSAQCQPHVAVCGMHVQLLGGDGQGAGGGVIVGADVDVSGPEVVEDDGVLACHALDGAAVAAVALGGDERLVGHDVLSCQCVDCGCLGRERGAARRGVGHGREAGHGLAQARRRHDCGRACLGLRRLGRRGLRTGQVRDGARGLLRGKSRSAWHRHLGKRHGGYQPRGRQ